MKLEVARARFFTYHRTRI